MPDSAMQRLRGANPIAADQPVRAVDELMASWGDDAVAGAVGQTRTAARATGQRRRARLRSTGLSAVLALGVGTSTAAAALAAFTGSPLPGGRDTVTVRPATGTTHLSSVRAEDPDGGPPWALRVGSAPGTLQCLGVGQVEGGAFGLVGLDGRFRAVEPAGADDCGVAPRPDRFTAQARTFLGRTDRVPVTVLYGVRGSALTSVRVRFVDDVTEVLPVGADGGFIVARRGTLEELRPRLEFNDRGRGSESISFAWNGRAYGFSDPGKPLVPSEGVR